MNKTHLFNVAEAISKFKDVESLIITKFKGKIDKDTIIQYIKIAKTDKHKELVISLIQAEKKNKVQLHNILYRNLINRNEFDKYLSSLIKTKEDGLEYALSLSIIDDYMTYLDTKQFNGPLTTLK